MNKKYFYAAQSDKGLNMSYNSTCWIVHAFTTRKKRDTYVNKHSEDTETVTSTIAYKIAPDLIMTDPSGAWRVIDHSEAQHD